MFAPTLTTFANLAPPWQLPTLDANFAALAAQLADSASWAIAGGTADAITATYVPANTALVDGRLLGFRATAANATTTPTFSPDGLTAHTITKNGGSALLAGDIPGALAEALVRYNLANTRWELLNPAATGVRSNFLITLTGFTASVTGTAWYSLATGVVTLFIPVLTGTSNATTMTATGIPAALQPATSHGGLCINGVQDNGGTLVNAQRADVGTSGTITFYAANSSTGFTAANTKGLGAGCTLTYNLN